MAVELPPPRGQSPGERLVKRGGRKKADEPEARFVRQLEAHSREAWSSLYDAEYPRLHRYFWAKTGSRTEADEIVSAVFTRALATIDSFPSYGLSLLAWLFQTAQSLPQERRPNLQRQIPSASTLAPDGSSNMEDGFDPLDRQNAPGHERGLMASMDLVNAIRQLSSDHREVILLRHVAGLSVDEIAAVLRKSTRAVYYLQAEALIGLKQYLG